MLFLINNPVVLLIGLIVFGFISIMIYKIVIEISLNKLLKQKHSFMRVSSLDRSKGKSKRIGLLSSAALAPIAVVVLVVALSTTNTVSPVGDILDVHDGQEVVELYQTFQNRMSTYDVFVDVEELEVGTTDQVPFNDLTYNIANLPDAQEGSDDYSETNNQVSGVHEMDNVVTDGKYIYTIDGNGVDITLAYTNGLGADALSAYKDIDYEVDTSECPTYFNVEGLYIDADYFVVIGTESGHNCDGYVNHEYYYYGQDYYQNVKVFVYDVEDDFSLESEYKVSGTFIGARKIDDNLIIVTSTYLPFEMEDFAIDDYLPYYQINEVTVTTDYENIVYVEGTSPNSYTSFFALDLDHEQVDMEVVLGDSGYNLYVSSNNIYLVGNIYYFAPMAEVLDLEEPITEIKTAILKVAINGASLEYENMGAVLGNTLNQFSMDEYNGNLRIATTSGGWGSDINNRLYILDEDLEVLSMIEGLGKVGERIQSVRFVGDYGYIVTFLQTDPFYVINLSDPEAPFKEGELEIPGFSTYLQPLNNNYMLGIGFGDNSGGTNGLKISVYDISDKTNPVIFSEVIFDYDEFGWGYTSATYNHKDLLVSLEKGLIALPFSTYKYNITTGYSYNSGVLVYNFDEALGLSYSGFVQHEENSDEEVYVYKSKFIDDYFYTISNKYIKVSTIDDPEDTFNQIDLD